MYAIIKQAGKQYKVQPGDILELDKIAAEPGKKIIFDQVLVSADNDEEIRIGNPLLEGMVVNATLESHGRGKKIVVFKMKRRKGYRRKHGHRQDISTVRIIDIKNNNSNTNT